ncbi:MAG: N-formylglutamate amidohydrolase [Roseobacter sp.]
MPLDLIQRYGPLIVILPHTGTNMPRVIADRLKDPAQSITAPDRFLDRLLHGLMEDATVLRANFHRYLSDVDSGLAAGEARPRNGMIGVVPLLDVRGESIWEKPPGPREAQTWRSTYYVPFHAALAAQIARVRARNGYAMVVTCRARPDEALTYSPPDDVDIWISTFMGASCAVELSTQLVRLINSSNTHTAMVQGRSTAGWITQHYGRPSAGTHALDLDLSEACYLTFDDGAALYNTERAESFRGVLSEVMEYIGKWRPPDLR